MAQDEVTAPRVQFGTGYVKVTDPLNVPALSAEVITDVRILGSNVCFSLASFLFDGDGPPEARVCVRVRVPLETWSTLTTAVNAALAKETTAKQAAN